MSFSLTAFVNCNLNLSEMRDFTISTVGAPVPCLVSLSVDTKDARVDTASIAVLLKNGVYATSLHVTTNVKWKMVLITLAKRFLSFSIIHTSGLPMNGCIAKHRLFVIPSAMTGFSSPGTR